MASGALAEDISHGKPFIMVELWTCSRCSRLPKAALVPAGSLEEVLGSTSDELCLISRRGAAAAVQPLQQLGMLSGSREPVQVPQGPQEARIGVPFTVCISNICRAVVRPLSGVLVHVVGVADRSGSSSVTFYGPLRW